MEGLDDLVNHRMTQSFSDFRFSLLLPSCRCRTGGGGCYITSLSHGGQGCCFYCFCYVAFATVGVLKLGRLAELWKVSRVKEGQPSLGTHPVYSVAFLHSYIRSTSVPLPTFKIKHFSQYLIYQTYRYCLYNFIQLIYNLLIFFYILIIDFILTLSLTAKELNNTILIIYKFSK